MAENATPEGDRIAKVLSRRGVASRREAERLIEAGEVKVNGKVITSPALNVTDRDKIIVSGQPLPDLEPPRLWLYYKPDGLVTSEADEKGRETVFANLPEDMPRVMSVGRLDLNSEGLLLLTNDGELKRRLELPSTGWLRKYRVRVNGNPTDPDLEPLRKGIEVEGEKFQPMSVVLDRIQGANAWLTVGLREGRNREIRRAMAEINLTVNRLIRVSYGPFRLGELKPGEVEEVRAKVLREQLGEGGGQDAADPAARKPRPTTRRLRPGEGIKALAKAWDEATAPQAPKRSVRTRSSGPEDDAPAPRKTASETSGRRTIPGPKSAPSGDRPTRTFSTRKDAADRPGSARRSPSSGVEYGDDRPAPRRHSSASAKPEAAPSRGKTGPERAPKSAPRSGAKPDAAPRRSPSRADDDTPYRGTAPKPRRSPSEKPSAPRGSSSGPAPKTGPREGAPRKPGGRPPKR